MIKKKQNFSTLSSSTSSSSTSCDSCSMNIALDANIEYYNHSYNESADHHSFIGRLMSTINMESNKKFDEDEDDNFQIMQKTLLLPYQYLY